MFNFTLRTREDDPIYVRHRFEGVFDENYTDRTKSTKLIAICSVCASENVIAKCGECGAYLCSSHSGSLCPMCAAFKKAMDGARAFWASKGIEDILSSTGENPLQFIKYLDGRKEITDNEGLQRLLDGE